MINEMNKYYEALNYVRNEIEASCWEGNEIYKRLDTLLSLIHKMEKIGLELNNSHFMDNDCKLKELEMIERIFKEC